MWIKSFTTRIAVMVVACGLGLGLNAGSALASTNPGPVATSFDFNTNLYGSTHFTVYNGSSSGNGSVNISFTEQSGPSWGESVTVSIEVQTCGVFGCHWDGKKVGGNCVLTTLKGWTYGCTWSVPISNTLHRIDWTKTYDGAYISGPATIK